MDNIENAIQEFIVESGIWMDVNESFVREIFTAGAKWQKKEFNYGPNSQDSETAFKLFVQSLGGIESDAWHDYPSDGLFMRGFEAGMAAKISLSVVVPDGFTIDWQDDNTAMVVTGPDRGQGVTYADETLYQLIERMLSHPLTTKE